jgi:hypothetical protein
MKSMDKRFVTVIGLLMVLTGWTSVALAGGIPPENAAETLEISGTVVHKNLEGGFFIIEGDDGRIYDPINLPETVKKDGLKVTVNAKVRNDVGGIHMVGDIIEIVDISAQRRPLPKQGGQ